MNNVNIKDIDLNNSFFHFTIRDNIEKINKEGLKAQIGDASKMKTEEKARVYMSKGGKGILGIKNSFIHEFKKLKICDIPIEYRKYFEIKDYSSEEIVQENDVFAAMEKRFKDEIYLKVNVVNGEDFIPEDFLPEELTNEINSSNNIRDIKGKADHDIAPDKLSIIITDKGDSTLDVLEYLYNRLMKNAKENGKEDSVRWALSDLDGLFSYIKQKKTQQETLCDEQQMTKLPLSLGLKINGILKDKIGFVPRENKIGMMTFEFTREELELIDKLNFENPVRGEIEGIELLPKLRTLVIKSNGNTAYKQDKNIASITDKDSSCIYKCKNLENLSIENQAKLSFLDVSQMKKLHFFSVKRNSRLEEISGLESTAELWQLDCYGNESLMQTGDLNKVIMQNEELTDINLDVLLFPDAMGYNIKSEEINEDTLKRFDDMNIYWHEILSSGKSIKINNYQMMQMHEKASTALEEYLPKYCEKRTTVVGIEQYLAENVRYDYGALKNNHSHSYDSKDDGLPSIVTGPIGGANGAYNAFTYGTCVCEGYTRAMQYLLRLKGIKSHNVHCISGEDKLHMSTNKQDDMYKIYDLPDDGYHSIISIDDVDCLYDDPCWNAGRYQKGDKSMPWTLLTKEEISKDHTLSFNERNIDNNTLNVPRSTIQIAMQRIANYRQERKKQQAMFLEQEIGKSTANVSKIEKDKAKERYQRNMQERTQLQELDSHNHNGSQGGTKDGR